jgi:hypothetical protein
MSAKARKILTIKVTALARVHDPLRSISNRRISVDIPATSGRRMREADNNAIVY